MARGEHAGAELSVVVQGPVHGRPDDPPDRQITRQALASVRRTWPACEIVLSTWKNAATAGLDFDQLVLNDDPGATAYSDLSPKKGFNNLNRQLLSTRNGLAVANRVFAIKLRSDCLIQNPVDFNLLDRQPRDPAWCLLRKPVIALNLYTRHPLRRPVLFHISDLFHAGLLCDLRTLWSPPLVEEPGFTRTIDPQHRPEINAYPEHDFLMRCAAEQYTGEQLARKKDPSLRLRHHSDGSRAQLLLWLRVLANNFLLQTPAAAGVQPPPHLAGHATDGDLFQPTDQSWLEQWTRPTVPPTVRWAAALQFREKQLASCIPSPQRRLLRRVLRKLLAMRPLRMAAAAA